MVEKTKHKTIAETKGQKHDCVSHETCGPARQMGHQHYDLLPLGIHAPRLDF